VPRVGEGTRTFGPRPPRLVPPVERRRRPWLPATLLAVAASGILAYLVLGPLRRDDGCPEVERPVARAGTQVVRGDPEGDGCETYGTYRLRTPARDDQDMFLTIEVDGEERSVRLGQLSDRLFLGDWDCDGTDTPGVYRWRRGEVQYYDTWPPSGSEPGDPDRTVDVPARSRAALVEGRGGQGDGNGGDGGGDDGGREGPDSGAGEGRDQRRCDRIEVEEPDEG
jgi:hypothetical protein